MTGLTERAHKPPEVRRKTFHLRATPAEVRAALAEVAALLARHGLSADVRHGIELVLAEALNNVVEHAYPNISSGPVRLCVILSRSRVTLQLRDNGAAMPGLVLPEGRLRPLGHDGDVPEGGFGWYLIRRLAAAVHYRRCGAENILDISMPRHPST